MRLEVMRAFVLADWMKAASCCESEKEFLLLLRAEQARVSELTEVEMDQIIGRDESRLTRFQTFDWELRTVRIGDCHVFRRMGDRAWAEGQVRDVASMFERLEPSVSRIWKMKLFAPLFTDLPIIVFQIGQKRQINDGSHRAIAMYLSGIREVRAYVGAEKTT
jgi:hypothetical protein